METKQKNIKKRLNHQILNCSVFFFIILLMLIQICEVKANNVQIRNQKLAEQNISSGYVMIQFDIRWENSWRVSSEPNNYDGIWLFVKYKKKYNGAWHHLYINPSNKHNTGTQGINATFEVTSSGTGAMFYRTYDGTGTFSSQNVKLRWDYETVGINHDLSDEISEIKVFAIEMVFVPQGAFYIGSGGDEFFHFYTCGNNQPFKINSEDSIVVDNTDGNLFYNKHYEDSEEIGSIPQKFPKGFNSFWCMKYETTQSQYAEFLNTLTPFQQDNRYEDFFSSYRYFIKKVNGIFGCDGNNNNILNEINDGQYIACNHLSWADGTAYADWAGMRPMTELEFEKACRGTSYPIPNEYAWGDTLIEYSTEIEFSLFSNETITPTTANCNCFYNYIDDTDTNGPVRVGNFARENSTRHSSGASYYGIMDLSGNLWERLVIVSYLAGRNFTGINGDGKLDIYGNMDVKNWPINDGIGVGFRGGTWGEVTVFCRVSDRYWAFEFIDYRNTTHGFRCVLRIE